MFPWIIAFRGKEVAFESFNWLKQSDWTWAHASRMYGSWIDFMLKSP
jgi:hypothetical protein